jgi:hypothetical protein
MPYLIMKDKMTFKHTKFEDSVTMRSLTKVAQNKGWIKEEPVVKTAAPQLDLKPSDDLTVNLLKLCNGLRASGFEKQAEELESKFVGYKRAQSLYGISNEEGDDLVHAAHPKGSHKLENVDSNEAVFEDILDRHNQFVEVVNKKPIGKLSSSRNVIDAVKVVFAQAATAEQFQSAIQHAVDEVNNIVNTVSRLSDKELTFSTQQYRDAISQLTQNPTIDNLQKAQSWLSKFRARLDPSGLLHYTTLGTSGLSEDTWRGVQGLLNKADRDISNAISWRQQFKDLENEQGVSPSVNPATQSGNIQVGEMSNVADPVVGKGANLVNTLKAYQSVGNVARNAIAMTWIKNQIKEIQNVMQRYDSAETTGQLDKVKSSLEQEMNTKEAEVNDFYNKVAKV